MCGRLGSHFPDYNLPVRKIAFFDFDGTLTRYDSMLQFARFAVGNVRTIMAFVRTVPDIVKWKLGSISNSDAKERLFGRLYRGMNADVFREKGRLFAADVELRPDVVAILKQHISAGTEVFVVSASISDWVAPVAEAFGIGRNNILATEAEVGTDGLLTGRFAMPNCHGAEKVRRIRAALPDIDNCEIWAYGDSSGDDAMLALANHPLRV